MSDQRDRDPDEFDDWLAETPGESESDGGELASPGGADKSDAAAESPEDGELSAAERERRRQEREERRRTRGDAGSSSVAGSGIGGSVKRMFSRDAGAEDLANSESEALEHVNDPAVGAGEPEDSYAATVGGTEGAELDLDTELGPRAAARAERAGRRFGLGGSGSASANYVRRRLMAGGAILAVIALAVIAVLAVRSLGGGSPEAPAPPVAVPMIDVTIPEGLSRDQIAKVAKDNGVQGNYGAASKRSNKINLKKYGAEGAKTLEGFLFPATYELNENGTARQLVTLQLEAFEQRIKDVPLGYAKSKNLNVYDILKIASMIEREIMVPKERRLAAAVIYNRLAGGQALGIDSTIRFEDSNYDKQLTKSRLAEDTPFNTRIRTGLPPTPIGNPGLAAIEAAANPKRNDVRFFVVKPGTCGEHVFTSSEEEFFEAEAAYQEALQREGGSPTTCPE